MEDDKHLDREKNERDVAEWTVGTHKPLSINQYKEAEGKEEEVGATQVSIEDNSPINEYEVFCEYNR